MERCVPNVPCGVERDIGHRILTPQTLFLMYRVELKGQYPSRKSFLLLPVPNVPCGVERNIFSALFVNQTRVPNVPCGVESRNKQLTV